MVAPETRLRREGLVEVAKDRWNRDVEAAVRWAQEVDWRGVSERVEMAVGRAWERLIERPDRGRS